MSVVRHAAKRNRRSIAAQVAHWMSIVRAIEPSPAFDPTRIEAVLDGQLDHDTLTTQEQAVLTDGLRAHMHDSQAVAADAFSPLGDVARASGHTE